MSQTLSKAEYVSCTILANQRTSIYSHQLAILRDNKLHFQMDHLPSVTLTQLKEPQIDARTRLISEEDKLAQIFYPIYMNERVSLQCLIPQHIEIDGEARYCDPHSLQFGPFPREIKVNGKIVLALHIPHHFSMKLAYMAEDFTSISLFKETNDTGTPFGQEIIGFFETAQPIHYSLLGMSIIVVLVLFTLFCCASYLNCPSLLIRLFCCCSNRCGLKQKVQARIADQGNRVESQAHLGTFHSQQNPNNYSVNHPRANNQLLIEMEQNPIVPNAETSFMIQNDQHPRQTGARMVQGTPIVKNQAPTAPVATGSVLCRNGYQNCFCTKEPERYDTCKGQGPPPPY
jgi:hypothetical protein